MQRRQSAEEPNFRQTFLQEGLSVDELEQVIIDVQDLDLEQLDENASQLRSISNSVAKQYLCGIGYLQLAQHHLLYGDMREPKLSSLSILTTDARTRRRQENQRKNDSYLDAARHAPELRDAAKEKLMLQNCIDQQGAQKQLCGIRTACMLLYAFATAGRGEQARNLRVCQRLNLDATPMDDSNCSMQPVEIMAFTKDIGKTSSGDTRDLAAIAPHKNVSIPHQCQCCHVVSILLLLGLLRHQLSLLYPSPHTR